jgi:hypothetical protein
MNTCYFIMQLDLDVHLHDANLMVSPKFNKSEVIETLIQKLEAVEMAPDLSSLNYVIRNSKLCIEGLAYELQEPPEFSFEC